MGTWFNDLTNGIKSEWLHNFSALILTTLRQKNTGLLSHNTLDFLMTGTDDGYFALYQLAQIGGHPLLNPYPIILHAPNQNADTDLASYLANWIQYLTTQALSGHFLSDRYFIIKFVAGLHPSLRLSLGAELECQIDHPRYDNRPLPFDFTLAHLWVWLQQRAQFIGFRGQLLAAPRDTQRTLPVQQISSQSNEDTIDINIDHLVAALSLTPTTCFFCHDSSHMAQACPVLLHTKSDPFARRLIICLLQDQVPSTSLSTVKSQWHWPCTPPTQPARIHAVLADHDSSPSPDNPNDLLDILLSDSPVKEYAALNKSDLDQDFRLAR